MADDLVKRLRTDGPSAYEMGKAADRIEKLESALLDVEVWISAPPTAYSIMALDGLFSITRERIRKALEGKDD